MIGSSVERRPSFRHRLEYGLLRAAAGILARAPEWVGAGLASLLGWIAGSLLRIRRGTVERNLSTAFPDRSVRWRKRVARAAYRHFAREAVSILRIEAMDRREIASRVQLEGSEALQRALESGTGAILLAGHFGNWEIAGMGFAARGLPIDAVVRRQSNPLFDAYMRNARARAGMGVLYRDEATRQVPKRLRESRAIAMVADQNAARGGIFVDFFGRPAATARGPGVLALRAGATVLFADPRRLPGWRARYRLDLRPIQFESGGSVEERVHALTRAFLERLEATIREAPEQYFWFHNRWRTRPEGEVPAGNRPAPTR